MCFYKLYFYPPIPLFLQQIIVLGRRSVTYSTKISNDLQVSTVVMNAYASSILSSLEKLPRSSMEPVLLKVKCSWELKLLWPVVERFDL